MREFVKSKLPVWLFWLVMAAWYIGLALLAFYFSFEPKAEFNYLNI